MINDLAQYGFPGICLVALGYYILRIEKRHKEERSEWRETINKQFDEQNKNIRESNGILQGLKTLLENRR